MRHLNKIIFINSANIPYAEVMLDGNVHFSGTQGVGKSTVLRAILFFYTASQMNLGIQKGQKTFEEFYFPKSNSYIVYEVKAEHGFYSILLSRSKGRPVFRFIDAPYNKEWIIGTDRRAESDWIRIREHIGKQQDVSGQIDVYETYRDIIFGNSRSKDRRYDKYAIVESRKYQNIPRSIQNVFLNSKLDADFIKTTIIQSMSDTEDTINLSVYRKQVADFEREFNEIRCWYQKDARGEIAVRTKADRVITLYRSLVAIGEEMKTVWHRLNFSVSSSRDRKPLLQDEIDSLGKAIATIDVKIEDCRLDYVKSHDSLKEKIGVCNARLKDCRDKRKHYEGIDIKSILALDAREPGLLDEKRRKESLLGSLVAGSGNITDKYTKIRDEIKTELQAYIIRQKEEEQQRREEHQILCEKQATLRDRRKKELDQTYSEWLAHSDIRMDGLREEQARVEMRLSELKYWHPLASDTAAVEEEMRQFEVGSKQLESDLAAATAAIDNLYREAEMELRQIDTDYGLRIDGITSELAPIKTSMEEIRQVIDRWQDSLYQWLSDNKPGWESTIGKVIDERNVLYASGLSPRLSEDTGFFGIEIDLDALEAHHRTPDDYREQLGRLTQKVEAGKLELHSLQKEREENKARISKSYNTKIEGRKQEKTTLEYRIGLIPDRRKDAETRLRMLRQKEDGLMEEERIKRQKALNDAVLAIDREKSERQQQRAKHDNDVKRVDSEYRAAVRESRKDLDDLQRQHKDEYEDRKRDVALRLKTVDADEYEELKGKGVDTSAIDDCRRQIAAVEATLKTITDNKGNVFAYRKDEEEFFTREPEFRQEKQSLEARDASLSKTYADRRARLEKEKASKENSLADRRRLLEIVEEGLWQFEQLCKVENILPEALLNDDHEEKNCIQCKELVTQMRGAVNRQRQKEEEMKRAVNSFLSHFGVGNTFNFSIPRYDEEYMAFAASLLKFVANNMIEVYRERMSSHYSSILGSISREVGMLINHSAEIKGILNEVNKDFRDRNFAGVIRSIEMRSEESSDRMMRLLRSINDFVSDNNLGMGEINLFSGDERDEVNLKVVDYLKKFMTQLQHEPARTVLTLSDTFTLQFRVKENDNDTGWVERVSNVGSDGTDILVKAMVNIMLINVFKKKASRGDDDFVIHCMMDEIGKLHPSNVKGILEFANVRNIYLINSSPMGYNADNYRYNYLLTKDGRSQTNIKRLITVNL